MKGANAYSSTVFTAPKIRMTVRRPADATAAAVKSDWIVALVKMAPKIVTTSNTIAK
jgi:hypothetical protein